MRDRIADDDVMSRLRALDPATSAETPGERSAVRRRARALLYRERARWWRPRSRRR